MTQEIQITIKCCGGKEEYPGQCLKGRCPVYNAAKYKVDSKWPYTGTGYGNLYGEPKHSHYLGQAQEDIKNEEKKVE